MERYIELTSNLVQMIILTWFVSKFFGYKYNRGFNLIGFIVVCLVAFIEISFINSIMIYDGLVSIIVVAIKTFNYYFQR